MIVINDFFWLVKILCLPCSSFTFTDAIIQYASLCSLGRMQGLLQKDYILVHKASKSAFGFQSILVVSTAIQYLRFWL